MDDSMISNNNTQVQIIKAVEAIVEATTLEADSLTQKTIRNNIDDLNTSFDSKLEVVSQSMKASNDDLDSKIKNMGEQMTVTNDDLDSRINTVNEKMKVSNDDLNSKFNSMNQEIKVSNDDLDSKINTLSEHIVILKDNMTEVKGLLATQDKRQKLEFAISCSSLQEFKYALDGSQRMSSSLVEKILKWFALGYGYHLPAEAIANSSSKTDRTKEEVFRSKLMKQLENLVGHKPRLVENGKGDFTIFYE